MISVFKQGTPPEGIASKQATLRKLLFECIPQSQQGAYLSLDIWEGPQQSPVKSDPVESWYLLNSWDDNLSYGI